MAEKHDHLVSHYRARLINKKYKIEKGSPFVDYRPDIFASKGNERLFVEVEIDATIHSDHTLNQLQLLHEYLRSNKRTLGSLVVPRKIHASAQLLIDTVFGDNRITVEVV
jgi:hypothetical protein